jgi:hypothetical protein
VAGIAAGGAARRGAVPGTAAGAQRGPRGAALRLGRRPWMAAQPEVAPPHMADAAARSRLDRRAWRPEAVASVGHPRAADNMGYGRRSLGRHRGCRSRSFPDVYGGCRT